MFRAHGFLERKLAEVSGKRGGQGESGEQRPPAQAGAQAGAAAPKAVIGWDSFLKKAKKFKKLAREQGTEGGAQAANGSEDPAERLWRLYASDKPEDAEALGLDAEVNTSSLSLASPWLCMIVAGWRLSTAHCLQPHCYTLPSDGGWHDTVLLVGDSFVPNGGAGECRWRRLGTWSREKKTLG